MDDRKYENSRKWLTFWFSNIFFGEDPAPKPAAAAVAKAAPAVSAGFQAAVKTTDSATNTDAADESGTDFHFDTTMSCLSNGKFANSRFFRPQQTKEHHFPDHFLTVTCFYYVNLFTSCLFQRTLIFITTVRKSENKAFPNQKCCSCFPVVCICLCLRL